MNRFFTVAMGVALSTLALSASAQKNYTEGLATYTGSAGGQTLEAKVYFKGDSSATVMQQGPANIKVLGFKDEYMAVLVDVPVANIKKAAVASPGELEDIMSKLPSFTFTPGTETKQIAGFNCKKVVAKDTKTNTSFDAWVTNDISAPASAYSQLYAKCGGFPVQFTITQRGQNVTNTLKSITDTKAPAGTFGIPAGFDKITMTDLSAMSGGR
ncbi:DUF4412 domain-containing protein [Mucilaginibacter daejeonensis]|uniref:DUF4412 domain-containing protein n=1 Tax=Mucilaginibacter daejeonensis TaxID=398049 RepID=UPI001D178AD0|nr:DUF4412 domain-containing protein [Mucilaginibacter daejeonensis]UEG51754.1 DUF4412 domain-containing protein [Mucilaginibacter daejeonensis]